MKGASPWLAGLAAATAPERRDRRPALALAGVAERVVAETPFCRLIRLEGQARGDAPPLLVVAPLSGHFTALIADLLAALAAEHAVHVTDWIDAREIPAAAGDFGVDDNIGHVVDFIRRLGAPLHLLGLCQSALPALAAAALLAAQGDAAQPRSLTLINGMLDPRIAPTRIDRLARLRPPRWYERYAIEEVPAAYPGAGRLIYPAALQHAALLAYLARHLANGGELYGKLWHDDGADAGSQPFLEAFLSVMDLPARFFLETIDLVFQRFALPLGTLSWRGRKVEPASIARTALMTVEGEHDDVSGPGQTRIAHALCRNIPDGRRRHLVQPGVGHFGTFHGRIWRDAVLPRVAEFIRDGA